MVATKRFLSRKVFTIIFVCVLSLPIYAQEDFGDDTNDTTPPASIDIYTPFLLVAAMGLGYFLLNKKSKADSK